MQPGQFCYFTIPFTDRPGSKQRPAVIIYLFPDEPAVSLVPSTSKEKDALTLLLKIDFDLPRYYKIRVNGIGGVSYLYRERWQTTPSANHVRLLGQLPEDDFEKILRALNLLDD